ncbi:MAG TPA: type II toxin-antitoxin system RelE/ParE family toxin [Gammaproteobacteria bacterium]|nr:type II toxin-antitoxin system RelE/ParE family toxin [Gammaproteobacteria bacterium]
MVIWTARARADLKANHDYIAKDSLINAKRVVREMHRKAAGLAETPHLGRVVSELEDPDIREIPAYSWRLIYQLRDARVFVLTVIHKRRQPGAADIA